MSFTIPPQDNSRPPGVCFFGLVVVIVYFDLTSDHRFSSTMLFLRGFVRAIVASYFSALLRCWETLDSTLESRPGSRANLSVHHGFVKLAECCVHADLCCGLRIGLHCLAISCSLRTCVLSYIWFDECGEYIRWSSGQTESQDPIEESELK